VASSKDSAYFAWQDSRNGNSDFQSEDIYFASARFTSEVRSEGDESACQPRCSWPRAYCSAWA
jgi:hypothetical protein